MSSCTGTTSSPRAASVSGGRSTSPSSKLRNSWLTLVSLAHYATSGDGQELTLTGFVYFASYTYFTSTYWPHLPNMGKCAGEEYAAIAGIVIISSYLVLFISFYFATYSSGKSEQKAASIKKRGRALSALKGMADEKVPTVDQVVREGREMQRRLSASRGTGTGYLPVAQSESNGHTEKANGHSKKANGHSEKRSRKG